MGTLTEEEHARLDRLALGLRMLGSLPLPWQQRCSALHEHPRLILETLLMGKQLRAASQVQKMYLGCNWSVRDKISSSELSFNSTGLWQDLVLYKIQLVVLDTLSIISYHLWCIL